MKREETVLLVVEDNDDDYFILHRAFQKAVISNPLKRVDDGQKAIYYLAGSSPYSDRIAYPLPGLVLLDLKLPVKHGFEVLKWIREQEKLKTLPVIVFSSSADQKDLRNAYEIGANAYLVKPASIPTMIDVVKAIETFWIRQNLFDQTLSPHQRLA